MRTIRNIKTGEIKQIDDSELGNYGLGSQASSAAQSATWPMNQSQGQPDMSQNLDTLKQLLLIKSLQDPQHASTFSNISNQVESLKPKAPTAEETSKSNFNRVLNEVEKLYFGENGQNALSYGRVGGTIQNVAASLGANPDIRVYNSLVESIRPTLAKAAGDAGNLALQEQIMAGKLLPRTVDTPEEARKAIDALRERFDVAPSTLPQEVKAREGFDATNLIPGATSIKNIVTAGVTLPQSALASLVGAFNPQLGGEIASPDILGTQKRAADISANPGQAALSQGMDSLALLLGAKGLKGTSLGNAPLSEVPSELGKTITGGAKAVVNPAKAMRSSGGALRESSIKAAEDAGESVSGTKYAKVVADEYNRIKDVGQVTKQITNQYEAAQKLVGKEISPSKAFDLYQRFDKAYTAGGKLAKGPVADYQLVVKNFLKDQLGNITEGGFTKGTGRIATGYKVGKAGSNLGRIGINAGSQALIYRLLGGFGGGQ